MTSKKASQQWISSIENHCQPLLDVPVSDVSVDQVVSILAAVFDRPALFKRLQQRISSVIDYAIAIDERTAADPVPKALLRLPVRRHKETHHAAESWRDIPTLFSRALQMNTPASRCLCGALLTGLRSSSIRSLRWSNWTPADRTLTLTAEQMKTRQPFTLPVTDWLHEWLKELQRASTGSPLFFPAPTGKKLSENAMGVALKRLGSSATAHGSRSTLKSFLLDQGVDRIVSEACLAHSIGTGQVEKAYIQTDLLDARRKAMQLWEHHLVSELPDNPKLSRVDPK